MLDFFRVLTGKSRVIHSAEKVGEATKEAAVEVETRISEAEQRLHNLEARVDIIEKAK